MTLALHLPRHMAHHHALPATYLIITQLLSESGEQMPQLRRRDEPVAVLVEVAETFDEVVGSVSAARLRDSLQPPHASAHYHVYLPPALRILYLHYTTPYLVDRQEHFEGYSLVRFQVERAFLDIRFRGVLPEGSESVPDLRHMDLAIASGIEQLERLLKFFKTKTVLE